MLAFPFRLISNKKDKLIAELSEENQLLGEQVTLLQQQVRSLQQEIQGLHQRIQLLKNGKNSKTSSTPPSQDIGRSNRNSLRPASTRKSGGQQGHKGSTLKMVEKPDEIIRDYAIEITKGIKEVLIVALQSKQ